MVHEDKVDYFTVLLCSPLKSRMDLTQSLVHVETVLHTGKGCEKVYTYVIKTLESIGSLLSHFSDLKWLQKTKVTG